MGMSLYTTAGYGISIPVDSGFEYGLDDKFEEAMEPFEHLSYGIGRWGDEYLSSGVFISRLTESTYDGKVVTLDASGPLCTQDEFNELKEAANIFGVKYDPKYVVLVSYW